MKNAPAQTISFPGLHDTEILEVGEELPGAIEQITSGQDRLMVVDMGANRSGDSDAHAALLDGLRELATDSTVNLQGGEEVKTLGDLRELWNRLHQERLARDDWLVVLGGGATLDLGALAASTWQRGIKLALVPTTLVGMVDAALGGKTAINFGGAKNQLGTFYPAHRILLCVHFLETLPKTELRNGITEAIKTALLFDEDLLETLETEAIRLTAADPEVTPRVIQRCLELKGEVVSRDPYDHGDRRLLNLGHTTAHALEAWGQMKAESRNDPRKRISHGRAVAWGVLIASELSRGRDWVDADYQVRLLDLYERYGLPVALGGDWAHEPDRLFELASYDKKRKSGHTSFVLPKGVGEAEIVFDVDREEFSSALARLSGGS